MKVEFTFCSEVPHIREWSEFITDLKRYKGSLNNVEVSNRIEDIQDKWDTI